jgi:hypothetical protein
VYDEVIHTTASHPWLTAHAGWQRAGQLYLGEPVRLLDGATAVVVALHAVPGVGAMWDLSLDATHTFAIGDVQAVVHNCPDTSPPGSGGSGPPNAGSSPTSSRNAAGELTDGKYTVSKGKMAAHLLASATDASKSVFANDYDAEQGVLDAAEYADQNALWNQQNQAMMDTGQTVGTVNPAGTSTTWIKVVRTASGILHGWPVKGP